MLAVYAGTPTAWRVASVRRWSTWATLLVLGVILTGGLHAFARMARAASALQAADDERRVLSDLLDALDDAENAERSYLVARDARFSGPYDAARAQWERRLAKLRRLAASAQGRQQVDAIDLRAENLLDQMSRTMAMAPSSGQLADRMSAEDGSLADLRAEIERMQADEKRVALARTSSEAMRQRWVLALFCFGVVTFAGAAIGSALQRARERKRRVAAEERAALLDLADQFIAVLGHDLRNPLGAIRMAGQLVHARAASNDERTLGQRIVNSSERSLRMIDDMLDLARTRLGGGIPLARTPGDLRDVVANVVDELRTSHPGRRIQWQWRGDGAGRWDPDRMSQAVSNLVANALQHGALDCSVDVALRGTVDCLELDVHNFGDPIPPERIPTLFRAYRGRDVHARSKGLGLGLFIAQQIVEAHGGTIEVRSSRDDGTTFTLVFPRGG